LTHTIHELPIQVSSLLSGNALNQAAFGYDKVHVELSSHLRGPAYRLFVATSQGRALCTNNPSRIQYAIGVSPYCIDVQRDCPIPLFGVFRSQGACESRRIDLVIRCAQLYRAVFGAAIQQEESEDQSEVSNHGQWEYGKVSGQSCGRL